jgi:hypothetical protein
VTSHVITPRGKDRAARKPAGKATKDIFRSALEHSMINEFKYHHSATVIGGSFKILKPPGAVKSTMCNSVSGALIVVVLSARFLTANKCA